MFGRHLHIWLAALPRYSRQHATRSRVGEIQRVIAKLQLAKKSGVWTSESLQAGIRKAPHFTSPPIHRISRGEKLTVLELKGDWWRVTISSAKEGWVQLYEVMPRLPAALSSTPGSRGRDEQDGWIEIAGRG